MNDAYAAKLQKNHILVWLFLGTLVYKFSMDLGYMYLSKTFFPSFPLDFDPLKYTVGTLWCVVLFFGIRHTEHRVSSFFLYFIFLFQIVPISVVYGLGDYSSAAYYHLLCLSFFLCELLVGYTAERPVFRRTFPVSRAMTLCYTAAALILLIYIIVKNGAPNLGLLNIYSVYEYRSSGAFQASKYMSYMLNWTTKVFLPFGIAKTLVDKRYPAAALLMGAMFLLYLYTGLKGYLFAVPLVLVSALWAGRKNFYQEIFLAGCGSVSVIIPLAYFTKSGSLWYHIINLFVRRTMFVPAYNKFLYYDYFLTHPKAGLVGFFPRWLINIPNPYEDLHYSYDIGVIYYNRPGMNANTGAFAEGNLRFGPLGTLLVLLLLALLLKQMDHLQDRAGYPLVIGIFIFPIFVLGDGHLLDSLILDSWMFLTALLIFYKPQRIPPEPPPLRLKQRRLVLRPPAAWFRL